MFLCMIFGAGLLLVEGVTIPQVNPGVGVDIGLNGGIASANLKLGGMQEFEICNADTDDDVGLCTNKNTCENANGVVAGECNKAGNAVGGENVLICCKKITTGGEDLSSVIFYYRNPNWPLEDRNDLSSNLKISVRRGVCQLRLDFLTFELPRPDNTGRCTAQNSMAIMAPGAPLGVLGGRNSRLCGLNTKSHLYIPASAGDSVQIITTLSGTVAVPLSRANLAFSSSTAYKWNIMITQVECDSTNSYFRELEAPTSCLQWFTESFGSFSSFNFDATAYFAPDQDYAICIRNQGNNPGSRTCGVTLRATNFGLPVFGDDLPACGLGYETVNEAAGRECCLNPSSSYLGFVARLPNPKYGNKMATKRYWCGAQLGRTGQISSSTEPYVIKVFSGQYSSDLSKYTEFPPVGFSIDYKIDTGIC
ncbi:uncharacterized protein LOC111706064 isoform X2 [Eurytemora carolleeae]|nr:uncharacterized protein LOC111706064 isoform X2 [Eurytemora carolleeae]|eukprot:XP_023334588.1 uncharacterized protein LOC111706064 isoform X2 [Eurytemora affinis]